MMEGKSLNLVSELCYYSYFVYIILRSIFKSLNFFFLNVNVKRKKEKNLKIYIYLCCITTTSKKHFTKRGFIVLTFFYDIANCKLVSNVVKNINYIFQN